MKHLYLLFSITLVLLGARFQSTAQCAFGGTQYPSTTFSNPGSTFVTVNTCIFGGEYQLYSVVSGTTYEWSYCTGDGAANAAGEDLQLTVFNNATGGFLAYADDVCGVAPKVTWVANFTGTVRVLTNLYNCVTNSICHTLVWRSVSSGGGGTGCNTGVPYLTYTVTCPSTQVSYASCTYAGEYNTLALTGGTAYTFGSSVTTDYVTITNAANTILASGTQPLNFTAPSTGSYRVYIHLNSACGTANTCRNPWVTCGGTPPPAGGCNTGVLYSSYTPTCIGSQETYAGCTFAGEYNNLTLNAGTAYTFGSSITTDFITITNSANTILTSGTQPVSFTPTAAGTYRVYIHTNSACGTVSSCRDPWVQCGTVPPPIPNDNCAGAIPITPGIYTGTTVGATADVAPTCITTDGTGGGVWYTVTGTGPCQSYTASLCSGTTYDSKIRVYSGSCTNLVCITGDDDFCNTQSQVTWNATNGTTYYILVHGFGANTGPFTLNLTQSTSSTITPTVATLPTVNAECQTTLTAPTATSSCSGALTGVASGSTTFSSQGTFNVTWTYNDGVSTQTQTQTVVIADITAPIPSVASLSPVTSTCTLNSLTPPTATDNCGGSIVGTTTTSFPLTSSTLVTWSFNDGNGNISTQTQQVTITDQQAPVPSQASLATVNSGCTPVTSLTPPTASDNCSGSVTGTTTTAFPITTTTSVVWTYTDGSGNTSTQNQLVVVGDNTAPVPNAANLTPVNSACPIASLTPPTATDNCAGTVTGTTTTTFPISSTTTVTWTFTDATGNTATQTQSVVISDVTPPVPSFPNLNTVTSACNPVASLAIPTANDNCSGVITGTTTTTFPITQSTTVVWTFLDAAGNSTSQNQSVVIGDVTAPVPDAASLSTLTSSCSITSLSPPTATDNCTGAVTGTTTTVLPITSSTTITWTFVDANGNSSTQTQSVVVNDAVAPIPDVAQLPTLNESCSLASITPPTATDNCSGLVTGTSSTSFPITQSTNVIWTFTDGAGNSTTQTQSVVISDAIAPVPSVQSLTDVTSACQVANLVPPTATDNCSGTINGTTTVTFPITTTTVVTWTFTDGSGNSVSQTQNVIVNDTIAPVPAVQSLQDVNSACAVSSLTPPTATDNCNGTITGTTTTTFPIASTTVVTWSYDDGNGNLSTQTQNVVVNGNAAPTPDVSNLSPISGVCEVSTLTPPTANDGCGNTIVGVSDANLPITASTLVTWTYTASNGTSTTQTQQVSVTPLDASTTLNGGTLSVNSPQTGAIYQWIDCSTGDAIAGANAETFTPSVSGTYGVEISFGSCFELSDCSDVTVSNSIDEQDELLISMYPNPVFNVLWFELSQDASIVIRDMNGKELISKTMVSGKQSMEIETLATGVYHVQIQSKTGLYTLQLIKQ